ncbi:hypothetical protein RRG08_029078 [Elysia crispata]|uniref:Uncharacterized protein n=1 Tax=Elysia crispata TaxID=231223 RepID=A0AAE0ZKL9_9GAST|nr:hypothetical protein RRG08_029078 [Elysia crispata]
MAEDETNTLDGQSVVRPVLESIDDQEMNPTRLPPSVGPSSTAGQAEKESFLFLPWVRVLVKIFSNLHKIYTRYRRANPISSHQQDLYTIPQR